MRKNLRDLAVLVCAGLLGMAGCGSAGPRTHPIQGSVKVATGEVKHLAGHTIEAAHQSDPTIRASGVIQPDGTFALETLHGGVVRKGAVDGNYQARIILNEDADWGTKRRQRAALPKRYLQFKTSGLAFQVPSSREVTLTVAQR